MLLERRRVALVEDDPIMGESLLQRLTLEGGTVKWWRDGTAAAREVPKFKPDIVICDIRLPQMTGEDLFRQMSDKTAAPFLFITGYGDVDQAVRLMRAGAGDYLTKPFPMDEFLGRLDGLLRPIESEASGVLGLSPGMRAIETLLLRLADRPAPVLVTGETGVGKEVCARFLHARSANAEEPFVAVNCAAIPDDLIESEIFGHERGAFSGAVDKHLGYAERAGGGTLFLDEIGEMPLKLQGKLLRLLENREIDRVGGAAPVPFRARVVTATNQALPRAVADGRFREDLLYRINVVSIEVPPLRDRPEDIPWLMQRFFDALTQDGTSLRGISSLAEEAAIVHAWPGNVRELRNRVERAVALADGDWIAPVDLFPEQPAPADTTSVVASLATARDAAERREIVRALGATSGQIGDAARLLSVSRTTLWEKMRRFGLGS
ncbi:sigma-54-dependent transcriptional regulator [Aurantimonas endophytica]|uniref:DNA-binding NtrC family response regulator n=1 Tax=Aurantimonas endophytica TaxID=1522175 RepID=A0A7W6HA32_9HYPH|nr:sigma-54 dependent transcriptional regulator [Aurantimonas endophytica]MBB4001332.1 DNA-binding NtrC family response regulator [Aurantimonas endophytica]MCO6403025.1 response regulator [Aurantimonas endophytica]